MLTNAEKIEILQKRISIIVKDIDLINKSIEFYKNENLNEKIEAFNKELLNKQLALDLFKIELSNLNDINMI